MSTSIGIGGPARATTYTRALNAQSDIQRLLDGLASAQRDLGTMRRLHVPSDDPIGAGQVMAANEQLIMLDTYQSGIVDARSRLQASDGVLQQATEMLMRIQELAVQANNGSLSASDRNTMAIEVAGLQEAFTQTAMARFGDEYLFSGARINTPPYASSAASATYQGDTAQIIRTVGSNIQVQINSNAAAAFEPARAAIESLRANLVANNTVNLSNDLDALQAGLVAMLNERTALGARMGRIESAQTALNNQRGTLEELKSSIVDLDVPQAITRLKGAEAALQSSLMINAKVMGLSLFDFLR